MSTTTSAANAATTTDNGTAAATLRELLTGTGIPKLGAATVAKALDTAEVDAEAAPTNEQRARLTERLAHTAKDGLAGKEAALWILLGDEGREAVNKREADEAALKAKAASKAKRSAAAKASGAKPPRRGTQHPLELKVAAARAKEIRGYGPGPKQAGQMREVTAKALAEAKLELTPKNLAKLVGAKGVSTLFAAAAKEVPLNELKGLKALGQQMGDDAWCKGGHLAAALAAWTDELNDSKEFKRLRDQMGGEQS